MKILRSQSGVIAASLLLGLAMIYYYQGLLIPLRQNQFRLANAAPGNWSDLYPRWLGAREVLLHRRNPYSAEVTRDIQRGFYGRPLDASNPKDPRDQESFAYPLYVVFLLAPSLGFSFATVRAVFSAALILLTTGSVLLWLYALGLRLTSKWLIVALIATMCSYPVLDGLHLQQLTLLVAALMAAAAALLVGNRLFLAGVVLACATIKPQLVILLALGLVLWALANWRSRKMFLAAFGITLAALLAGSEIVLPGWFTLWRQAAQSYVGYVRPSLLTGLLGSTTGLLVGGALVLGAIFLFWQSRREPPRSPKFNLSLVSALLVTTLLAPNAGSAKYNLVLLIPGVLWLLIAGSELKPGSVFARFGWLLAFHALLWQWLLALVVAFAVVVLRHPVQREATPLAAAPEILVFFFPLALLPLLLSSVLHIGRIGASNSSPCP